MIPAWIDVAWSEMGQAEIAGAQDNPRIVEYHSVTTLKATDDETPWCASFACWCLAAAGLRHTNSARARDFEKWGKALSAPRFGAIVTFTRDGGGHVGFYVDTLPDGRWLILGGNQSNRVRIAPYDPKTSTSIRWPA